jgi:hypothetical protein
MVIVARTGGGVFIVGRCSDRPDSNDRYGAFVRELAANPDLRVPETQRRILTWWFLVEGAAA